MHVPCLAVEKDLTLLMIQPGIYTLISIYTSRKLGFGHRAIFTLAPVQSRTGTNVSIGPGSCGQGPVGPRGGIGPGSSGPFGPGWWYKPGPMGHAPGPPPFSPGSYHKPGLKGWS